MIFSSAEEQVQAAKKNQEENIRLAKVTSLDSSGRAKVTFFGEDTESGKTYTYIDGYVPTVGDNVAMLKQGNTFIILGAIVASEIVVKYALKEHTHSEYALTENVATKDHTHDGLKSGTKTLILSSDGAVVPDATESYDLGSSAKRYKGVYAKDVISDTITVNGTNLSKADLISKLTSSTNSAYYVILSGVDIIPYQDKGISLGTSSKQFNNIYAASFYLNGSQIFPYRISSNSYTNRYLDFKYNILTPSASGVIDIGSSTYQLQNVYSKNVYVNGSAITTSDRREKKYVKNLRKKYLKFFKKLRPVTYQYRNGTSGRTHAGFIAQEVEQAMQECGITDMDFGGLVKHDGGRYALRYEEFIALQTAAIQELQGRVEELERRVKKHGIGV